MTQCDKRCERCPDARTQGGRTFCIFYGIPIWGKGNGMRKPPLEMTRICAVCGKEILLTPGWAYKKKGSQTRLTVHYCSWACMREAEKRQKIEKAQRRTK